MYHGLLVCLNLSPIPKVNICFEGELLTGDWLISIVVEIVNDIPQTTMFIFKNNLLCFFLINFYFFLA